MADWQGANKLVLLLPVDRKKGLWRRRRRRRGGRRGQRGRSHAVRRAREEENDGGQSGCADRLPG